MKPFNLERALAGDPVITTKGEPVEQLHLFEVDEVEFNYPLVGVCKGALTTFTKSGEYIKACSNKFNLHMASKTMKVNGYEIEKSETTAPKSGTKYWIPDTARTALIYSTVWANAEFDNLMLNRKVVHLSKENALNHAKAMLGILKKPANN